MNICHRCGSTKLFNRHTYLLCLDCGNRFAREKHSISTTDWQLKVQALEAERDRLKGENDKLRAGLKAIVDAYNGSGIMDTVEGMFQDVAEIAARALKGDRSDEN